MTPEDADFLGLPWDDELVWPNSRAVRLTVKVPRSTRALVPWMKWADKNNVDPEWRRHYEDAGGGRVKAKTWFIHWGTVPTAWIVKKEDLAPPPRYDGPVYLVAPRR